MQSDTLRATLSAVAATGLLSAATAFSQEPGLLAKLQGTWGRSNANETVFIKGKQYSETKKDRPLTPNSTGKLEFPPGKDYAVVRTSNKFTLWIFPAGDNAIAIEVFRPDMTLNGSGIIYYKDGKEP